MLKITDLSFWRRRRGTAPDGRAEDRNRMLGVVNNLVLHLHPATVPVKAVRFSYTWGLGGISAVLALMLGLTGLLLMYRYDARVSYAYTSIQAIETQVTFGSLVRAIHHWSANLLVVAVFLHLLRVFISGGYKRGRTANWLIGVALLLVVLASNFTGYLLPWDQLAYWAITVSTSLFAYIPQIGNEISRFLLAGPEVGQGALSNFYAMHVVTLPLLLTGIMGYHFWKIRKNGGISQPDIGPNERVERVTTIPHLVQAELAVALLVILGVTLYSMANPAPLGGIANPLNSPNPAKAAWYFLGLQELLLHMHPLAAITLVAILLVLIFFTPLIDRKGSDVGIYFRSAHGRWAALIGFLLGINLTPLMVVADEYWIDLERMLTFKSSAIASGVVPVVLTLGLLAAIYFGLRIYLAWDGRRADHSEAMLGVFVFVATSLVVLTVIGIFFRGENMALVLPF